jgi:hypothetical protein
MAAAADSALVAVAVVGKQNDPLYLRSYESASGDDDGLTFHYLVHTALDTVREKLASRRTGVYLGLLLTVEDYKVFGYTTNTKVVFIFVVRDPAQQQGDRNVKQWLRELHELYASLVCNPFTDPAAKLNSPTFDRAVDRLVDRYKRRPVAS